MDLLLIVDINQAKLRKMPEPWMTLLHKNAHPRDACIHFDEPTHIYTVNGTYEGYISVTGFLHHFFPHFDPRATIAKMRKSPKFKSGPYAKMTDDEIVAKWEASGKEATTAGTAMHLAIEQFLNGSEHVILPEIKETIEWRQFMEFWNKHGWDLEPYRTEWEVWVEEIKLAGSLDMVFRRKSDGRYLIYDWKRSKEIKTENPWGTGYGPAGHLPDCNYWHYSLQLNIYKWVLEKYYGLDIADMYLVICHPNSASYKRLRLNHLDEEVEGMVECRRAGLRKGTLIDMSAWDNDGSQDEAEDEPAKDKCDFIL
jgi:ATP-dependent exoDNAse (exonuclease V) beta subunit